MAEKKVVIEFEFLANQGLEAIEQTKKQILDLKTQKEVLKLQNKEETKEYALLDAQLKNLNKTLKSQQSALEANLKAIEANDGSLKSMREQLKSLVTAYDSLGKAERESESGQALAQKIAGLTQEIKDLEYETERYGRNVGNYGNSIQEALGLDTTPLKTQLRSLTQELQAMTLQQRQLKDSLADMTDPQEIADTESKITDLGTAIQDTAAKAGQLSDVMQDTGRQIKANAEDFQMLKGISEGIGVLADSYTVLKSATVALGIENEALIDIFAKLQTIQMGVNSLMRISNALQKEGAIRTTLLSLKTKIMNTELAKLIIAKRADQKASVSAAKADLAMAAGEGAASKGAVTLSTSLKGVGLAIKSIPIVGWILAATTALAVLIKHLRNVKKETEEYNKLLEDQGSMMDQAYKSAAKETRSAAVNLQACAKMALEAAAGSKEQEYWVRQVAEQTGLTYDYLKNHLDIMPKIVQAYINMAKAKAAFEKGLETQTILENQASTWNEVLNKIGSMYDNNINKWRKRVKKYLEEEVDESLKTTDAYKRMYEAAGKGAQQFNAIWVNETKASRQAMEDAVKGGQEDLEKLGQQMFDTTEEWAKYNEKTSDTIEQDNKKTVTFLSLVWGQLYKNTLSGFLKTFDAEVKKQREDIIKGWAGTAEELKQALTIFDAQKILERSTGQMNIIKGMYGDLTSSAEKYSATMMQVFGRGWETKFLPALDEAGEKISTLGTLYRVMIKQVQDEVAKLDRESFLQESLTEIKSQVLDLESTIGKTVLNIQDVEKAGYQTQLGYIEQIEAAYNDIDTSKMTDTQYADLVNIQNAIKLLKQRLILERDITRMYKSAQKAAEGQRKYTEREEKIKYVLDINEKDSEQALQNKLTEIWNDIHTPWEQKELLVKMAVDEESIQKAERELAAAKSKLDRLLNVDEDTKRSYGEAYRTMVEELETTIANGEAALAQMRAKQVKESQDAAKAESQARIEGYQSIANAMASAFGSISSMFDTLAEQDERYGKFAKAMALAQIAISTSVAIIDAVRAAVSAGMGTGVAAPITIPLFIAELTAAVLAGVASATATLKQTTTPHYAHGGYVSDGTTSKADDVTAMVSKGEYIVQADAVKMYGKDYFDSLNAGLVRGDMDIAGALRSALADMPSPIVSVKEINNMQDRVRVKESISRGK